jgi:hypothetical protein
MGCAFVSSFFRLRFEEGLAKLRQGRLHFVAGVDISRLLGDNDAIRKCPASFVEPPKTGQKLAELEVSCHIGGMFVKEFCEMIIGGAIISEFRAFERESVAGKCIVRFCGDELLKHFTPRLLRLGHGRKRRIIFALQ